MNPYPSVPNATSIVVNSARAQGIHLDPHQVAMHLGEHFPDQAPQGISPQSGYQHLMLEHGDKVPVGTHLLEHEYDANPDYYPGGMAHPPGTEMYNTTLVKR